MNFTKTDILRCIQKSRIFNDKIKADIIFYFDSLNKNQINGIIEALENENIIVLNFLKSLKDKNIMSFEEIKNNIESLQRTKRYILENEENKNINEELSSLLKSLEEL